MTLDFPRSMDTILERIDLIDPVAYARSRNFIDGSVSYLSPYISRGVISTKLVMERLIEKGYNFENAEKFFQELAWRDYWQQVWIARGDEIDKDLKNEQSPVRSHEMPKALIECKTGIEAIDHGIERLRTQGYMHNHLRMYVAALACNVGQCHWKTPAQWMYYHLLDGDWASNALSWQWVAGSNSHKKYLANQQNINKYTYSNQKGSFLDKSYEAISKGPVPMELMETVNPGLFTELPGPEPLKIDPALPTLLYNYYNLDPNWRKEEPANRILIMEPSFYGKYPVSSKCLAFISELSKNIPGIQLAVCEFKELIARHEHGEIFFREHPTNRHYRGREEPRDWMSTVKGYHPSFFSFWKKCKKELRSQYGI